MQNDITIQQIERFLYRVDTTFPVFLSSKQKLHSLAEKFHEYANLRVEIEEGSIISMVAGYIDHSESNIAYISIVATLPEKCGRGYARKLIREFISEAKSKEMEAVHLYTDARNIRAINMYLGIGFEVWAIDNEPRPNDVHLIYMLSKTGV